MQRGNRSSDPRGKRRSRKNRLTQKPAKTKTGRSSKRDLEKDGGPRTKRRTRSLDDRPNPALKDEKLGHRSRHKSPGVSAEKIRLNRYIANSGVCSRREADQLIRMGVISVNGSTITELGYKVNPGDKVRYENRLLNAEKPVYILLNKPKGYLTTTRDPMERTTVMALLGASIKERIYPVGRLDRNTTGLLLLTNDGELAEKLSHPSYNVKKIYKVELDRPLSGTDFKKVSEGVLLDEGKAIPDDIVIISEDRKTVGLELHIGWNRVVRRVFEALNYEVVKLDRTVYAGLDKRDLPRGKWRFLTDQEVVRLKYYR